MKKDKEEYKSFTLWNIEETSAENVILPDTDDYYRIELPTASNNNTEMDRKGFIFVDRTIGVGISLNRNELDYNKLIRFEIKRTDSYDSVLDIALSSFPNDRRFHICPLTCNAVAEEIIQRWVSNLTEVYVCIYKEEVVGFIDLEPYGNGDCFIHLAAVKEKYRASGVAVSLYAFAILKAKEKGCNKICGRISSSNIAVMNLYARLGGIFSDPRDVFVRKEV